jgi:hypothetical protein
MRAWFTLLLFVGLMRDVTAAEKGPEIPPPQPKIANGAWAAVLQTHPRLLGPKTHLKDLARSKPDEYRIVQGSESLTAVGIVEAVEGAAAERIKPLLEMARRDVARGVTNVHQDTWIWLNETALVYDQFQEKIPADQRAAIVQWLNGHLEKYTDDEGAFHNSTLSKILCYLRVAYATWGENPRAKEFRDYALLKLYEGRVAPVLRQFGAGGGFTECGWYSRGSLWNLVEALELARRFEGYDGFQQAPRFFYQRLAYELYQAYPGLGEYRNELYPVEGDGSNLYGSHRESPRHLRTLLAQYFRGSELARYTAATRRKGSNPEARIVDFLYEEPTDEPLELKTLPLAHLASGIGRVYARSDWTDDATWLRFECGDFWNNHQHFEVGNFEIFRREPLATESGEYADYMTSHAVNWLIRTIAHNCILVRQPDERWKQLRDGGRNAYANDGGQTNKWGWTAPTLDQWNRRPEAFDRGDLVAYDNRPEFLFLAGDCTAAYAPGKLACWIRQIVFLQPSTIVVFDRVESTKPEYEKMWLLHMRPEPTIAGNDVTVTGQKSTLVCRTLLPQGATIRKIEGYTYDGKTFDERHTGLSDVAAKWRVEVLPAKPAKEDLFLHVLFTDKPQPAHVVQSGKSIDVKIGDSEIRFTGKVGGSLTMPGSKATLAVGMKLDKYE